MGAASFASGLAFGGLAVDIAAGVVVIAVLGDAGNVEHAGVRTVAVPARLRAELEVHLATFAGASPDALLFATERSGDVPRASAWTRIWNNARDNAGVPDLRFHDLRHLAGTLTALTGGTIKEIQSRLGHASPDAAMIYQHAAQGRDGVLATEIDRIINASSAGGDAMRVGGARSDPLRPRRSCNIRATSNGQSGAAAVTSGLFRPYSIRPENDT